MLIAFVGAILRVVGDEGFWCYFPCMIGGNLPLHSIVGFLAVRDPHDLNGVADYAGRARLAARVFGHSPSLYLMR
jgi:hypothetical protein